MCMGATSSAPRRGTGGDREAWKVPQSVRRSFRIRVGPRRSAQCVPWRAASRSVHDTGTAYAARAPVSLTRAVINRTRRTRRRSIQRRVATTCARYTTSAVLSQERKTAKTHSVRRCENTVGVRAPAKKHGNARSPGGGEPPPPDRAARASPSPTPWSPPLSAPVPARACEVAFP